MERKDWVVPLISGVIGILGAVSGGVVTAHYQERLAERHARIEQVKASLTDRASSLKELKNAGVHYLTAQDAFINTVLLSPEKDKAVLDQLTKLLAAGAEVMVMGDEDLVRQTNAVNASTAAVLLNRSQPLEQRMEALSAARAEWMRQLKRSLEAISAVSNEGQRLGNQAILLKR